MRIVCISDTHNFHDSLVMPPGDLLIHAGDATMGGTKDECVNFLKWFAKLDYPDKLFVPGNHDFFFQSLTWDELMALESEIFFQSDEAKGFSKVLLSPQETSRVDGFSILGSPWSLPYGPWAFMADENAIAAQLETRGHHDILVTHGPPFGMCDLTKRGQRAGSEALTNWIAQYSPSLVICGHIHEARGAHKVEQPEILVVNAACCNFPNYQDLRQPILVDIQRSTSVQLVE